MKGKLYYIFADNYKDGKLKYPGVQNKIEQQKRSFERYFDVTLLPVPEGNSKLAKRFLPGSHLYHWELAVKKLTEPECVYIRKPMADRGFVNMLAEIRRRFPKTKLIIELPTYPYDKEQFFNTPLNYPLFVKDVLSRRKIHKYADRIVSFSADKKIFSVPVISIFNGVDVVNTHVRAPKTDLSEIHLLAIATFQVVHGYERVIRGLSEYIRSGGKRRVILDMVGSGPEEGAYRELTKELGLEEYVRFHGPHYGSDLDSFYDNADIALGAFGSYKTGVFASSPIKVNAALAAGLPVVAITPVTMTDGSDFKYAHIVSNDPSIISTDELIEFYDKCYNSGKTYSKVIAEIRNYAEKYVTWDVALEPVIRYIKG